MASNIEILDGNSSPRTMKTTDDGVGVHTPHHNVDAVVPGTAAADLGKAEDAAHSTGDVGVMALGVRKDTATALAGTDGDYQPAIFDASGRQHVNVGNTVTVDSELTTADLDTGGGTDTRAVVGLALAESGGALLVGSAHPLPVSGAVSVSAVTPGTTATALGKAEDAAHSSGDAGVMALAVRNDAGTALATTDGDYIPFSTDSSGALRVTTAGGGGGTTQYVEDAVSAGGESLTMAGTVRQDTPAGSNADGDFANLKTDSVGRLWVNASGAAVPITDNAGSLTVDGTVTASNAAGDVAHDGADSGNPVKVGGKAVSSEPAAVSAADRTNCITDLVGKLITLPYANPEQFENGTTGAITDTTSTAVLAAAAAGVRHYITSLTVTNSHATVGTFVKLLDGATIIWEGYCAAAGGGFSITFPTPLRGTAATAMNIQPVTTGANIIGSVAGYQGK